ncbi:MAG: sigma-70 family RNA polymerase sigma factor [Dokdonella sp.]
MQSADESTQRLLERLNAGDADARERLLARYLPRLTRWAHGRLPASARDLSNTQDLVQITVLRVLSHLQGFQSSHEGSLLGYLQQALLNVLRNEIRRVRRRGEHGELPEDLGDTEDASPLALAVNGERLRRYEAALARLPRRQQEMIVMRVELGLDYREIAEEFASSPDAVRMALRRAVAELVVELSDEAR